MSTRFPWRLAAARTRLRRAVIVLPSLPISLPVIVGSQVTPRRHRLEPIILRSNWSASGSRARTRRMYSAKSSAAVDELGGPELLVPPTR